MVESMIEWLRSQRHRWVGALVLVLVASFIVVGPWARASEGDVVAEVNGEPITREMFYEALEAAAGPQVLDQLITETLLLQAGEELKEPVTDAEVEEALASLKAAYPNEAIYQATLAAYGLDEERLARQLKLSMTLERLATQDVTVTDEEVAAYFEEHQDELAHPERVRARHILVETREEAEAVIKALEEGKRFEELAAEHSLDTATKDKGGDVGFFSRSDNLVASFKEAAFALKVDEVSEPVESPYGFHVIQVTDREAARPAVLEEEAENIRATLIRQKATPASEILSNLLEKANVVIRWERYQALQPSGAQDEGGATVEEAPREQAEDAGSRGEEADSSPGQGED
ncbi:MAG TPA: peptidyl-prolyl cis-trans isomerase [Limnochorda sp.]